MRAPIAPLPSVRTAKRAMSAAALVTLTGVVNVAEAMGVTAPVAATVPFAR